MACFLRSGHKLSDSNWGAFDHASHAPHQVTYVYEINTTNYKPPMLNQSFNNPTYSINWLHNAYTTNNFTSSIPSYPSRPSLFTGMHH